MGSALHYLSTRGADRAQPFEAVLLAGLARDGGLYLPQTWPRLGADQMRGWGGLTYPEIVAEVVAPFVAECFTREELHALTRDSYAVFSHKAVAPLKQIGQGEWLLELFHGPTFAFKDYALQLVGRMFDSVLAKRDRRITIVGATSGDTGSAAIEACRDRARIDIVILYPHGRVSEVQRRQMTTVSAGNVRAVAIDGTFDDCQDLVKALFADAALREEVGLAAVNSINWARIMAQVAYYVAAAVALGAPDRPVSFAVPTGNFGNVYAAYVARAMGLPISELIIGSNRNDILTRFFATGAMRAAPVEPSLSPSMDIQISSNFERYLFDLVGRDGAAVCALMQQFRASGEFSVNQEQMARARSVFAAHRLDDSETRATIAAIYRETGEILDPHSAIGVAAARAARRDRNAPIVAIATAHPAKFPEAVQEATGRRLEMPARLAAILQAPERIERLPNDLDRLKRFVRERATAATARASQATSSRKRSSA
jgi:threonine synthase